MIPVANRPILEHTLDLLKRHKITDILFLLFYLPEYVEDYFGDGSKFGVKIEYIVAKEDYGTAGAVKLAAPRVKSTCLVVSADAVTDLNLSKFIRFHKRKRALLTLSLAHEADPCPFGIAMTDKNHRLTRFLEKPSWGQVFSDTVNMGIYAMEPEIFEAIPCKKEYYFAKDLFPELLKKGERLFGYVEDGYWKDIGDLRSYQQVHWDALQNAIRLEMKGKCRHGIWRGQNCKLGKGIEFEGTVMLGDHCTIENGVRLQNAVIGDHCRVGDNSSLRNTILWKDVVIGKGCELSQTVVASESRIADHVFVDENVFISNGADIGAASRISANVKIWPHKEIEYGAVVNSSVIWGEKWHRELFTDSRVSGLANFEISPEFGGKLGVAFGTWIGQGNYVLVSRDASPAARMIYRSIMAGIMSAGVHVENLQVMPIPIVRYTLRNTKDQGGVHIRRSPFDRKLMDVLFFDADGRDFSAGATKSIERVFFREDFPRVTFDEVGNIDYPVRVTQSYLQDFLNHIDTSAIESAKPRIVIDYSYGAATQVFPSILGSLDCEVISLNALLDPKKMTRTARAFEQALNQLSKIVKSTAANAGFLLDAGAEKVFCVDERGEAIPGSRLAALIAKLHLEIHRPSKIAVPVSVPSQLETLARKNSVELVYTPDDPGSLIQATEDPEVNLAVDTKGGFIFSDFHFAFDGMYSVVKILELLARTNTSLGALNLEMPKRSIVESRVPCPWEAKGRVMRELDKHSQNKDRLLIDGVRILTDDSWVLVVPNREQAFYHILAEAKNERKAKQLVEEYEKRVINWVTS